MTISRDVIAPLREAGQTFSGFGWLHGTSGNLSRRYMDDQFVITVSGRDKGNLSTADFVRVNIVGETEFPHHQRPSAETSIHQVIYHERPDIGAVYHVHDPYAALCSRRDAQAGETTFTGWEMIKGLGVWDRDEVSVPILPNHNDVPQIAIDVQILLATLEVPGVNILNHGVYAWGATPAEAKRHIETFGYLFKVSWEASRLSD